MNEPTPAAPLDLAAKIARLVEEKGWNQEDFANISGLNRQTVRQILQPTGERSLRNSTVAACARALGLSVNDLRTLPLERLLSRITDRTPINGDDRLNRLVQLATQAELRSWIERNPDRARQLTPEEIDELLALQDGRALTAFGVESFVMQIERRRSLVEQVRAIANTEFLDLLEQLVGLIYDRVQPGRDRI
jgi:transcriptional regulator with XRE-family HTH domain